MTKNTDDEAFREREPRDASRGDVTELVIRQFPDEALMRRRAYSQTVNRGKVWRRTLLAPERQA